MVCSRCILHHPHELQSGKYPSFLAEFHWGMPPLLVISTPSSARITVLLDKQRWLRPKWYVFSLYLYHVGHLNLNVKCLFVSNTLDYIAALIRTCCACRQQDGVWSARERSGNVPVPLSRWIIHTLLRRMKKNRGLTHQGNLGKKKTVKPLLALIWMSKFNMGRFRVYFRTSSEPLTFAHR